MDYYIKEEMKKQAVKMGFNTKQPVVETKDETLDDVTENPLLNESIDVNPRETIEGRVMDNDSNVTEEVLNDDEYIDQPSDEFCENIVENSDTEIKNPFRDFINGFLVGTIVTILISKIAKR